MRIIADKQIPYSKERGKEGGAFIRKADQTTTWPTARATEC